MPLINYQYPVDWERADQSRIDNFMPKENLMFKIAINPRLFILLFLTGFLVTGCGDASQNPAEQATEETTQNTTEQTEENSTQD